MEIFQISALAIIGALLAVTLKNWRPELALAISIAAAVGIILSITGILRQILLSFENIISQCGLSPELFTLVIKLTGIAYVTKFAGELCKDCGENAIASKVELAGKASVLLLTLPVISKFINAVTETLTSF